MNKRIGEIGKNFKNIDFNGNVIFDEPLSEHTTMKVGGKAVVFVEPFDEASCVSAVKFCKKNHVKYYILGGGSNLIFNDNGFEGVIISTKFLNSISYKITGNGRAWSSSECPEIKDICDVAVKCGSGVSINDFIEFCENHGLQTLPTFSGLPGTCGGAAYMNARCYSSDVCEYITEVEYIKLNRINGFTNHKSPKLIKTYKMNNKDWYYKHSPFTNKNCLITSVVFKAVGLDSKCLKENKNANEKIIEYIRSGNVEFVKDRENKGHFKAPSAGSVFKNNREFGSPSGKIIDEVGLKGTSVGGAQIAPWHGNFIINNGNAKAKDIEDLVNLTKKTVKEKKGFDLECEIIFVS